MRGRPKRLEGPTGKVVSLTGSTLGGAQAEKYLLSLAGAPTTTNDITGNGLTIGGTFTASPWGYDGKVFCLNEEGETAVIQGGPEFKILGRNPLGETSLATPAICRGRLLIRTATKLYCIKNTSP
jgi:hypothetical protein